MASVNSPVRKILKPILFKLFGKTLYPWFQYKAKVRDIEQKLVEEKEMELLPYFLSTDDEAIDIGANYAYYTVRLARMCRKVYAFEPIPFTHKVCAMVVRHYNLENVSLFNKGVGEKNEWHKFKVPVMEYGAISAGQAHFGERDNEQEGKDGQIKYQKTEEVDCEVIALDSLFAEFKNLSFLKIDIEGAEYFALKGMKNTLQKFKPVILLEINPFFLKGFQITEQQMKDLFVEAGYLLFIYDNNKLKEWKGSFIESNYLLIHRENINRYQNLISYEA